MVQLIKEEQQIKKECITEEDYLSTLENIKNEIDSLIITFKMTKHIF